MAYFQVTIRQNNVNPGCGKGLKVNRSIENTHTPCLPILLGWAVHIMLKYYAHPMLHGVIGRIETRKHVQQLSTKLFKRHLIVVFHLKGLVKPWCMLLGQSSLIIKTITEYIYYFVAHSIHRKPENQPRSAARAHESFRGKKSTFPVAVHMLLLLIKKFWLLFWKE